jgi:hypothetical protein
MAGMYNSLVQFRARGFSHDRILTSTSVAPRFDPLRPPKPTLPTKKAVFETYRQFGGRPSSHSGPNAVGPRLTPGRGRSQRTSWPAMSGFAMPEFFEVGQHRRARKRCSRVLNQCGSAAAAATFMQSSPCARRPRCLLTSNARDLPHKDLYLEGVSPARRSLQLPANQ